MALVACATLTSAQDWRPTYNLFGEVGLIDMPTADMAPDAEVAATIGGFSSQQRTTFTFQVTPRLSGSFRYSHIDDFWLPTLDEIYDRSFDLRYQIVEEGDVVPAVAIGLRDFIGTGLYTSEYIVATKGIGDNLRVTGGLGWGRLGTRDGFSNPFGLDVRPPNDFGVGGTVATDVLFRGDAAFFGGVEWQVNADWGVKLEYSSDAYVDEASVAAIDQKSPLNIGVTYTPRPGYQLSASYLYGSEISVGATIVLDPTTGAAPSGLETAPIPVSVRPDGARAAQSWDRSILPDTAIRDALTTVLAQEGIEVLGLELSDRRLRLRYENTRYRAEAQAAGRVARILTHVAPWSIETFVLEPVQAGIPLASIALSRSDIERLENEPGAARAIFDRAVVAAAGDAAGLDPTANVRPSFTWGLAPYMELTVFDGDQPVRGDLGLELSARYEIRPNLVLEGAIRKRLIGNRDEIGSISPSTLPPVRRNAPYYAAEGDPGIEYLTLAWYGHPGANLYSRVTAGYLERMFGGVSTELLWKPVNSPLALGAELNYVAQRDYDMMLGFQDYDVVTGHLSAYYAFDNGFHAQVDVGRYLAGDWGATFSLDREFENGWRVGAYVTLTDVSYEDFGEGSFDKGIRVTVPFDWAFGQPSRREIETNLSSLTRDGGARLNVDGRLYDVVRDGHIFEYEDSWGRFWR